MAQQVPYGEFKLVQDALLDALAKSSIGDFSHDIAIDPKLPEEVKELLVGVQVLLDVIREKIQQLEAANAKLEEAQRRSVNILDEVLRKSVD